MMDKFIVTENAKRPASSNDRCFYCHKEIGADHEDDCGLVQKKVTVRAIIEYEISCPAHWGKGMIEFHRNESSWCAGNMILELERLEDNESCLCDKVKFEYIGHESKPYLDEK